MTLSRQVEVQVRAATLPDALTIAMRQLVDAMPAADSESDYSQTASIQAEAANAGALLPLLTGSLAGLLEDFEAAPVEVSIHGLRWLPGSVRVWGTVTVSREDPCGPMEIEWIAPPMVKEIGGVWNIEGDARIISRIGTA